MEEIDSFLFIVFPKRLFAKSLPYRHPPSMFSLSRTSPILIALGEAWFVQLLINHHPTPPKQKHRSAPPDLLSVIGSPLLDGPSSNSPPSSSVSIKKCFPGLTVLTEEKYIAKGTTDPRVECSQLSNCFYILSSQVDQNSASKSRPNASLKISTKPQYLTKSRGCHLQKPESYQSTDYVTQRVNNDGTWVR